MSNIFGPRLATIACPRYASPYGPRGRTCRRRGERCWIAGRLGSRFVQCREGSASRASVVREFGPVGNARLEDWPPPECRPHEICIKVEAVAANFVDILVMEGR